MYRYCCLLALFFTGMAAGYSQTRIDTDRPDQTESAVTVPHKWIQLEAGFGKQVNSGSETVFQHPTLLSKYGISNRVELRLITTLNTLRDNGNPASITSASGLSPVELGAKIALWEEKKYLPKTSLIFHVGIPKFASDKMQTSHLAPNFRFTMQHSISEKIGLGYNIGAQWDGENPAATWIYTIAPGINIGKRGYAYIEAFGFISRQDKPEHSLDGGVAYFINKDIKIDLSSGFGISKTAPARYVAIGCSVRFKTGK